MGSGKEGLVDLEAIHKANDWLYHDQMVRSSAEFSKRMGHKVQAAMDSAACDGPEYPGDDVMVEAVASKVRQWKEWKGRGMDIVASSILDDIVSFVGRLKELT